MKFLRLQITATADIPDDIDPDDSDAIDDFVNEISDADIEIIEIDDYEVMDTE